MAKQRKKKKKHEAPMPPLSALDKFIYIALIVINFIVCIIFGLLIGIIKHLIAFSDNTVIASRAPFSDLLFIPFLLFIMLFGFISLLLSMNSKTPVFGKKGITYGPPMYKAKYPLFMRNKPDVYVKPSEKQWRKTKRVLISGVLILTLIPLAFSFCGRKCITKDVTLQRYNAVNIKRAEYTVDEIKSATFRTYYSLGTRHSTGHWEISVKLTTNNNKNFKFLYSDFKPFGEGMHSETLDMLLSIKSKLDSADIEYDGTDNLDDVAKAKGFNPKEKEMLYELFNTR